jgi:hypothetical protein
MSHPEKRCTQNPRICAATADKSWLRGIPYMVDSIEEKKQHLR